MANTTSLSLPLSPTPASPDASPAERGYFTYLNFGENVLALVCQLVVIPLDANLLITARFYKQRLVTCDGISHSLFILVAVQLLLTITVVPYHFFSVLWWRPAHLRPRYSLDILYWIGIFIPTYSVVPNVAVFFLTADRLLVLSMRYGYDDSLRRQFMRVELVALVLVAVMEVGFILGELPLKYAKSKAIVLNWIGLTWYIGVEVQFPPARISPACVCALPSSMLPTQNSSSVS